MGAGRRSDRAAHDPQAPETTSADPTPAAPDPFSMEYDLEPWQVDLEDVRDITGIMYLITRLFT